MPTVPEIDTQIIHRCRKNDAEAFQSLVKTYQNYTYALAFRLLWNEQDAEDAVQESFLRVWQNIDRFEIGRKFSTWLYTIVTNLCRDMLRQRNRSSEIGVDRREIDVDSIATQNNPGSGGNAIGIIRKLAGELPVTQRLVFVLRDLQNISVKGAARILNTTENAVKSNLCYARKSLRQKYQQLNS